MDKFSGGQLSGDEFSGGQLLGDELLGEELLVGNLTYSVCCGRYKALLCLSL